MHGTYVGNGRMLVQTGFGAKLFAHSDDLSLTPDLVLTGGYDGPFTEFVRRELSAGMVAIDVGANIGLFTVLFGWQVGPTGRVIAFEPEPGNLALLRENVAVNYFSNWVDVVERGVGANHGQAQLHVTTRFRGNSSVHRHDQTYLDQFGGVDELTAVNIEIQPLDDLAGRFERIDLVKIDVEGAELDVLRGMRGLLASGVVQRSSVEIGRERGADWDALIAELRDLQAVGWAFSSLDAAGIPTPLTLEHIAEVGRFSQVLIQRS